MIIFVIAAAAAAARKKHGPYQHNKCIPMICLCKKKSSRLEMRAASMMMVKQMIT
jgi:hypothetical protein